VTLQDDIETLRYFNEKVDKLANLSFTRFVTENAISTPDLLVDAQLFLDKSVPSDESIDAFVLTLRLFLVNNEPISIGNVAKLYERLPVSDEKKALVQDCRDEFNRHLNSYSHLGIEGKRLLQSEIFYVFLYGGLAHGNDRTRRATFQRWRSDPRRFAYLKALFVMLLMDCLEVLFWLRHCNTQTLEELATNPPNPA
jgi:hypothetical protein